MSTLPAVADALLGIAAAMRMTGTRWYLFGAQAAIMWGRPRLSADVDVTVELSRDTVTEEALGQSDLLPALDTALRP